MSWLSQALRGETPKPLKTVFGNSYLDEFGGVGGFLAGGPAGAAAGAAAGRAGYGAIQGEDIGSIAKGSLGTGAKAGAIGYGAALAGVSGSGSVNIPGVSSRFAAINSKLPGLRAAVSRATPSWAGQPGPQREEEEGGFFSGPDAYQKAALISQGLGALVGGYGAHQEGKAADREFVADRDDMAYQRERRERFDPFIEDLLKKMMANRRR